MCISLCRLGNINSEKRRSDKRRSGKRRSAIKEGVKKGFKDSLFFARQLKSTEQAVSLTLFVIPLSNSYLLYILTSIWVLRCALQTLVVICIFNILYAKKLKTCQKKVRNFSKIWQKIVFLSLHQKAGRLF